MDKIKSVKELFDALSFAESRLSTHQLWWRGNALDEWNLTPKVFLKGGKAYEKAIAGKFHLRAKAIHPNCPSDDDEAGWRFLMQHYHLPTRLLDWSESILVAAFFAVREPSDKQEPSDKDGALWALNPYILNSVHYGGEEGVIDSSDENAKDLFKFEYVDEVAAIYPSHLDFRMMVQSSMFTVHGSKKPLELYEGSDKYLYKFVIPADVKKEMRNTLELVGIKESFLFPGLEYLAKELSSTKYITDIEEGQITE